MSSSSNADVSNDLAYVRAIAEEGRNAPLTGGLMFVWWGSVIGLTALLFYFANRLMDLPAIAQIGIWSAGLIIGWGAGHFIFESKVSKIPGGSTFGNKTAATAWQAVGLFITVYWLALTVNFFLQDKANWAGVLYATMFPVSFGLFGVTYMVTATAVNQDWLKLVALASWAIMVVMILTIASPYTLLFGALGCLLVVVLQGLKMMRDQPSEIV